MAKLLNHSKNPRGHEPVMSPEALMLQRIGSLGVRVDRLIDTIRSPMPGQTAYVDFMKPGFKS